jgi:hypothetical protein
MVIECAALAVALQADGEEPLVTDRPTFTESARVVDRGRWQFETGATYDDGPDGSDTSLGEVLVRWGMGRDLELRLSPPSYLWVEEAGDRSSGFVDAGVGLKYQVNDGSGSGFLSGTAATVTVSTTMPTGGSAVTSSDWQPRVSLAAAWTLAPSLSLGANLGSAWLSDGEERFGSSWASLFVNAGFTDLTAVFVELYGLNREQPGGSSSVVFQTGITYLADPNVQLDARIARGLSDVGPEILVGVGASWRF